MSANAKAQPKYDAAKAKEAETLAAAKGYGIGYAAWAILFGLIISNNDSEKRLNAALSPHLRETTEGVDEIIGRIERASEILRRDEAERIFP